MATTAARLTAVVDADTRRAEAGLNRVDGAIRMTSRSFGGASVSVAKFARNAGLLFGGATVLRGMGRMVTLGASLEETISKVRVSFGDAAGGVISAADEMADRFGIVKQEFLDGAAGIGLIAKAGGLAEGAAAAMGTQFAKLATDVSSFHNIPVADALVAIRAGLVGESEPLRRLGVLLDEASVQQEGFRLGLVGSGDELTQQQKVIARASLIVAGFSDETGDLERTQGSLANVLRRVRGDVTNLATSVGQKLGPFVKDLVGWGYQAAEAIGEFAQAAGPVIAPVLSALGDLLGDVWRLLGAVVDAVGPVVAAFAGLAAAGILKVLEGVANVLGSIVSFFADNEAALAALIGVVSLMAIPALLRLGTTIVALPLNLLVSGVDKAGDGLDRVTGGTLSWGKALAGLGIGAVTALVVNFGSELASARREGQRLADTAIDPMADADAPISDRIAAWRDYQAALTSTVAAAEASADAHQGVWGSLKQSFALLPGVSNEFYEVTEAASRMADQGGPVSQELSRIANAAEVMGREFGLTAEETVALGETLPGGLNRPIHEVLPELRGLWETMNAGVGSTTSVAEVMVDLGAGIEEAEDKVKALDAALAALLDQEFSVERATREWEAAIDSLTEAAGADGFESTLDAGTAAGRSNAEMLESMVALAGEHASAVYEQTRSVDDASEALAEHRASLIEVAREAGFSESEIARYTEALDRIPAELFTALDVDTEPGDAAVRSFMERWRGQRVELGVRVTGPGGSGTVLQNAADGGVFRSFAGGGEHHVAQIAPAGAWRVWAEPETGGEAYIPLGKRKRQRSQAILAEVARRFGMVVVDLDRGVSLLDGALLDTVRAGTESGKAERWDGRGTTTVNNLTFHEKVDPVHVAAELAWRHDR